MSMQRRRFIQAAGAAAGASALGFPSILGAQAQPIRLGLLTVKTGALASGGIDMERGLNIFLKEKNYTIGGRKVDLGRLRASNGRLLREAPQVQADGRDCR